MNEILATFSMCFAFCFLLEGIETAIKSKANRIYKVTHNTEGRKSKKI